MNNKLSSFLRGCGTLFLAGLLFANHANADSNGGVDWEKWDDSVIRLLVVGQHGVDLSIESGTAFAINDKGDYITNHHVIATALKGGKVGAVESLEPEKIHDVEIVWESETHDLAMVHVDTWKNPGLTLSDGSLLKKGQEVFSIGFPGAADRDNAAEFNVSTLKKGVFSAFKNFSLMEGGRNIKMIEHDAPVNSGNSGGPLADACGRVVGINEQKSLGEMVDQGDQGVAVNSAEGILFSINTVELMALLKEHNVDFKRDDSVCAAASTAAPDNQKMLLILGAIALLTLIGFAIMYRSVQRANNGQFNTRVLSRMIRDRIGGNSSGGQTPPANQQPRGPFFDPEAGRIRNTHLRQPAPAPAPAPTPTPAPQPQALYRLVPQRNDLGLPTLTLPTAGNYRLGRNQASNIQLVVPNQYVSSNHLLITVNPGHSVMIEDLGSMNGTHVAGVAVPRGQLQPIQPGQTLRIGHDETLYVLQKV